MSAKNRIVLDSYALIGYLENEAFAGRIEKILRRGRERKGLIWLHAIHLGEVYYITLREQGQDLADLAYARIRAFPVTYVDVIDEELLRTAADIKAKYPISYADALAAALAVIKNAVLLTGDPEFKILEKQMNISIEWLV